MSTYCEYKFLASATAKQSQLNNQHVQAKKEVQVSALLGRVSCLVSHSLTLLA
jgi:hypothetical protein